MTGECKVCGSHLFECECDNVSIVVIEWLFVKDEVPQNKEVVLATSPSLDKLYACLYDDEEEVFYIINYEDEGFEEVEVDRWIPLPERGKSFE